MILRYDQKKTPIFLLFQKSKIQKKFAQNLPHKNNFSPDPQSSDPIFVQFWGGIALCVGLRIMCGRSKVKLNQNKK